MRNIIISEIVDTLLHSDWYGDYIHQWRDNMPVQIHNEIVKGLNRLSDTIVLSLYKRLLRGDKIVPCHADNAGDWLDLYLPASNSYGGMDNDGVVHT